MFLGERRADLREQRRDVVRGHPARDLLDDHELFLLIVLDRERDATTGTERRVQRLDRALQILRVVVSTADDDQILVTAGDEQLAVAKEAEISRAEVTPVWLAFDLRVERLPGLLAAPPVPLGDARSGDPDLADASGRTRTSGAGIDDPHALSSDGRTGADERRAVRLHFDGSTFEGGGREARPNRFGPSRAAGDDQRSLGEAVAGIERLAPEAGHRERVGEAIQRLGTDRLGAAEGDLPVTEVEARALLGRALPDAEIKREVRAAADRSALGRHRLEPPERPLEKRERRHQRGGNAAEQRLEDPADQPHVVVRRQPDHRRRRRPGSEALRDQRRVVEQVAVTEHHALRRAGRSGRVLQEGERLAGEGRRGPVGSACSLCVVGGNPVKRAQVGRAFGQELHHPCDHRGGERDPRAAVGDECLQSRKRAPEPCRIRWVRGNGDHPGVEAAKKSDDVLATGRVEEQDALAGLGVPLDQRRDRPRGSVEFANGDRRLRVFVEERERTCVGLGRGATAENVEERRCIAKFGARWNTHGALRNSLNGERGPIGVSTKVLAHHGAFPCGLKFAVELERLPGIGGRVIAAALAASTLIVFAQAEVETPEVPPRPTPLNELSLSMVQWSYRGFLLDTEGFVGLDLAYRRAVEGLPFRYGAGLRSAGPRERVSIPLEAYGVFELVGALGVWQPAVGIEVGLSGFNRLDLAHRGGIPPAVHRIEEERIGPLYLGFNASALRFQFGRWTVSALELQLGTSAFPLGASARTQLGLVRIGGML